MQPITVLIKLTNQGEKEDHYIKWQVTLSQDKLVWKKPSV